MGLFDLITSVLRGSGPPTRTEHVAGPGTFAVLAVDESHYVGAFEAICGLRKPEGEERAVTAILVAEPLNRTDANAIYLTVDGRKVGYLSPDNAIAFAPLMKKLAARGARPSCRAVIRGGWLREGGDRGFYGLWLDLPQLPGVKLSPPSTAPLQTDRPMVRPTRDWGGNRPVDPPTGLSAPDAPDKPGS